MQVVEKNIMSIEALSWAPKNQANLLHDIQFNIKQNKILGVVGANGAGKSSLLRCLYRLHQPSQGKICLFGQDIWQISPQKFAQKVAVILQESPADFAVTVRQIIEMGRTPYQHLFSSAGHKDTEIIDEIVEQLQLGAFMGRQFSKLSGGEKQRVYVARALAQQPEILILDEPTNHLDIRHQLEIMQLISTLGITIIITLHDLNLAAIYCDEILWLHEGKILAHDNAEAVFSAEMIEHAYQVNGHVGRHIAHDVVQFQFSLNPNK